MKPFKRIILAGILLWAVFTIIFLLFTRNTVEKREIPGLYSLTQNSLYHELELFENGTMRNHVILSDGLRFEVTGKWRQWRENIVIDPFITSSSCSRDFIPNVTYEIDGSPKLPMGEIVPIIEKNFGTVVIVLCVDGGGENLRKQ